MSKLNEMTIKELVQQHDELVDDEYKIGKWHGRKDALVDKVALVIRASRGQKTIREVAEAMLIRVVETVDGKPMGMPYADVLEGVLKEFPDARTTVECLRWYSAQLNKTDARMPVRPRKKVAKAVEPVQAVADTPVETRETEEERVADPLA